MFYTIKQILKKVNNIKILLTNFYWFIIIQLSQKETKFPIIKY